LPCRRIGTLYLLDADHIRRVTPAGQVTTLAGGDSAGFRDGPAAGAQFNGLAGIAVDAGGTLYLADRDNHRIRKLTPDGQGEYGRRHGLARSDRWTCGQRTIQ